MFNVVHDRFVVKVDFVVRKDPEYPARGVRPPAPGLGEGYDEEC